MLTAEQDNPLIFLAGGGEMGNLTRNKDWKETILGEPTSWPQSLRTVLSIILNSKFPMFLFWGPEQTCFYNDAYRLSLGKEGKHPSILGMKGEKAWPEIWPLIKPLIDKVLEGGEATWSEDQLIPIFRNGKMEDVYWTFSYSPVNNESGKPAGVFVTCNETTEKMQGLIELHESEERFRTLADNIPNLAWMAHADGSIYWYNKKWYEFTGTTPEEMEGWGWQSVHHPDVLPGVLERWKQAISEGSRFEMVFPLKGINGDYRHFLTRVQPFTDENGKITRWFGSNTDVTLQKETEEALKESRNEFEFAIEAAKLGTFDYNPATNRFSANDRLKEWFGLPPGEQIELAHAIDPISEKDRERVTTAIQRSLEYSSGGDYDIEYTIIHPTTRNEMIVHAKGRVRFNDDHVPYRLNGTLEDISERYKAAENIKVSEQKLQAAVEAVKGIVWTNNANGEMVGPQPGWTALTGQQIEEYRGFGWTKVLHPDDVAGTIEAWQNAVNKITVFEYEHRLRTREGNWRIFSAKAIPLINEDGSLREWVGVHTDIHKQKILENQLEKQVLQRTLELEEKNLDLEKINKELESFAYISSHDLQEPLRKIRAFSSMLLDKEVQNLTEGGKDLFTRMQNAAERMQTLIDDLLAYSRTSSAEREFVKTDLNVVVEEVKEDLKEQIQQKNAIVETNALCEVNIIPFQFRQLLQNLVSNSLKFSKPDRPPHIIISGIIGKGADFENNKLSDIITYCHISITDNGIGFAQEYSERIFELFQRLHGRSTFHGTGIGLAIVKKIVENHHGTISATGEENKGAGFDIYIPVFQEPGSNALSS